MAQDALPICRQLRASWEPAQQPGKFAVTCVTCCPRKGAYGNHPGIVCAGISPCSAAALIPSVEMTLAEFGLVLHVEERSPEDARGAAKKPPQ